MVSTGEARDIPLEKLQLNLENPRYEEQKSRDEAMIKLLQNEKIEQLARDIAEIGGINPMERMGVFPLKGSDNIYVAAEGNRRLCALLLLDDPEAVPASISQRARYVRTFSKLSENIDPIVSIPCVIFRGMKEALPWLQRLHNGARNGTGRVSWTAVQQARSTGVKTNQPAIQLRDLAIKLGIISKDQLDRTITTQQRFLSDHRFRQAMGLVLIKGDSLERVSCWHDFQLMLKKFMNDIAANNINSRTHNNATKRNEYAQELEKIEGLQRKVISQGPLKQRADETGNQTENPQPSGGKKTKKDENTGNKNPTFNDQPITDKNEDGDDEPANEHPDRRTSIRTDNDITIALNRLQNHKLINLYQSISTVRLPLHTLLAVIGCWSFFESLTMAHGRKSNTEFTAHINSKASELGLNLEKDEKKARHEQLSWLEKSGNITKHNWLSATFDYQQLCNAMDALKPVIIALIEGIEAQKQAKKKPLAEQDQS